MRIIITVLTFLVSLTVTGIVVFFLVFFLAGPHGGILPSSFYTATLIFGWLLVVAIPIIVARWVWRRFSRTNVNS